MSIDRKPEAPEVEVPIPVPEVAAESKTASVAEGKHEVVIPYLHKKVDSNHIKKNGKLMTDEDFDALKKKLDTRDPKKLTPNQMFPSSKEKHLTIIKQGDEYYAIYCMDDKSKSLGAGAFGSVHLMQNLTTGEWLVLKKQKRENEQMIDRELQALETLSQLKLYKEAGQHCYTGMTLAKGTELHAGIIEPKRTFPTVRWFDMSISVLKHLRTIHLAMLIHRDIKPANMVMDPATGELKLVDVGLSAPVEDKKISEGGYVESGWCGTQHYMAPELEGSTVKYNEATDVYAMGVSLREMFEANINQIKDPAMRQDVHGFIQAMCSEDPKKRPSLEKAIEYFEKVRDMQLRAADLFNRVAGLDIAEHKVLFEQLAPEIEPLKISKKDLQEKKEIDKDCKKEYQKLQWELHQKKGAIQDFGFDIDDTEKEIEKLEKRYEDKIATANQAWKDARKEFDKAKKVVEKQEAKINGIKGIDALKKADEVWLIAPEGVDPSELVRNRRMLEEVGMIVSETSLSYNKENQNIPQIVQSHAEKREATNKNIYLCANLDKNLQLDYPKEVTPRHLAKVIQTLQADLDRLYQKDHKANHMRIREMRRCLTELKGYAKNNTKVTYDQLGSKLETLQTRLYSNNGFYSMLEKGLKINISTSRKKIAHVRKDLEEAKQFRR